MMLTSKIAHNIFKWVLPRRGIGSGMRFRVLRKHLQDLSFSGHVYARMSIVDNTGGSSVLHLRSLKGTKARFSLISIIGFVRVPFTLTSPDNIHPGAFIRIPVHHYR